MSKPSITMEEVAQQIRRALLGEIKVSLVDPGWCNSSPPATWDEVWAGEVSFWFGDWKITFFNDCDELDYTEVVEVPDGRITTYSNWVDYTGSLTCPKDLLTRDEYNKLVNLLKIAG